MDTVESPVAERQRVRVRGTVQGVGFRPFVWRLARELGLDGWVLNDAEGVLAEVQGAPLRAGGVPAPRGARRAAARARERGRARGEAAGAGRRASPSPQAGAAPRPRPVTPDAATCPECLAELFDPGGPALPLPVHQLHALRPALHHHARRSLRPPAHHDGALRHVPGVRARVRATRPTAASTPSPTPAPSAGRGSRSWARRASRSRRGDVIAARPREDPRRQGRRREGPGRLPPRLRRAQRARGGAAARRQAPRGEALRRDGGQRRVPPAAARDVDEAARRLLESPRASHRAAVRSARAATRRSPASPTASRRWARCCRTRPAVAALPRGERRDGRHGVARRAPGARPRHDERQPRRRAAGHRQRRGGAAPGRHRRRVRRARPRHRRALRRQPRARHGRGARVRAPRPRLHAARHPPAARRPAGPRHRRLAQEHRVRDARRRGVPLAAHRRPRQRPHLRGARRGGGAPARDPRGGAGRPARTTCIPISTPAASPREFAARARHSRVRHPAPPRPHRGGLRRARPRRARAGPRARRRGPGHRRHRLGRGAPARARARASSAWGTWASCACPAATAPRASPGAWPPAVLHALGRGGEIAQRFARPGAARRARDARARHELAP